MQHKLKPRRITLPLDKSASFSILDASQTMGVQSGLVTLMPGENVGEHSTGAHEETIIILEGRGEVQVDGHDQQSAEYGHVFYVPPDMRHNVFNIGEVPLRYIYVVARVS
jgi:mannose-6-phosphate isomerase-like protein (cupin superfamily)